MKLKILSLILTFLPISGFSQITLRELEAYVNMDYNSFETSVLNKGYELFKHYDSNTEIFKKSNSYLYYSTDPKTETLIVEYHTSDKNQFISLKSQCSQYKYKFYETITLKNGEKANKFKNRNNILIFKVSEPPNSKYRIVIYKRENQYFDGGVPFLGSSFNKINQYNHKNKLKIEEDMVHENSNRTVFYSIDSNLVQSIYLFNSSSICIGWGVKYYFRGLEFKNERRKYFDSNFTKTKENNWEGEFSGHNVQIILFEDDPNSFSLMFYEK